MEAIASINSLWIHLLVFTVTFIIGTIPTGSATLLVIKLAILINLVILYCCLLPSLILCIVYIIIIIISLFLSIIISVHKETKETSDYW
jgi:hypothetical protein